jgi:hypothetical protein
MNFSILEPIEKKYPDYAFGLNQEGIVFVNGKKSEINSNEYTDALKLLDALIANNMFADPNK